MFKAEFLFRNHELVLRMQKRVMLMRAHPPTNPHRYKRARAILVFVYDVTYTMLHIYAALKKTSPFGETLAEI